jgi:hypothetical protein
VCVSGMGAQCYTAGEHQSLWPLMLNFGARDRRPATKSVFVSIRQEQKDITCCGCRAWTWLPLGPPPPPPTPPR